MKKNFVNFMAYISVAFIAVALILGRILGAFDLNPKVISSITLIANIISYAITAVFAFYFAKTRNHIAWMICYVIFVVAIIVFVILEVF